MTEPQMPEVAPTAIGGLRHPPQVEPISWEWHGVEGADGKRYVMLAMHTPGAVQTFTFLPQDLERFAQQAFSNAQRVGGLLVASSFPPAPNGHREA